MKMTISDAINFLEAKGFMVRGYGYPESEWTGGDQQVAESYRVLQGDYDTGMIHPHQLVQVAERMKGQ